MTGPAATPRRAPSLGWRLLFAGVMLGALVTLAVVVGGDLQSSKKVVEAFVGRVRAGEAVTVAVGGDEAVALTEALRSSRSLSVGNVQSQAGTSCVWVTLRTSEGEREARFVLTGEGEAAQVAAASLARECECPDPDFDAPCHLR